jgi:hypothetical protein
LSIPSLAVSPDGRALLLAYGQYDQSGSNLMIKAFGKAATAEVASGFRRVSFEINDFDL